MSQYLASRVSNIRSVKDDILERGHSKFCPLHIIGDGYDKKTGCAYCEKEFVLVKTGRGCPCGYGYCKDRLLEGLNKWIAIAEKTRGFV